MKKLFFLLASYLLIACSAPKPVLTYPDKPFESTKHLEQAVIAEKLVSLWKNDEGKGKKQFDDIFSDAIRRNSPEQVAYLRKQIEVVQMTEGVEGLRTFALTKGLIVYYRRLGANPEIYRVIYADPAGYKVEPLIVVGSRFMMAITRLDGRLSVMYTINEGLPKFTVNEGQISRAEEALAKNAYLPSDVVTIARGTVEVLNRRLGTECGYLAWRDFYDDVYSSFGSALNQINLNYPNWVTSSAARKTSLFIKELLSQKRIQECPLILHALVHSALNHEAIFVGEPEWALTNLAYLGKILRLVRINNEANLPEALRLHWQIVNNTKMQSMFAYFGGVGYEPENWQAVADYSNYLIGISTPSTKELFASDMARLGIITEFSLPLLKNRTENKLPARVNIDDPLQRRAPVTTYVVENTDEEAALPIRAFIVGADTCNVPVFHDEKWWRVCPEFVRH